MTTESSMLSELDTRHHLHPFTDYAEMKQHGTRIITAAEGHEIIDADGKRILDAMAGLWCVNIGYGRHELVEAATRQMTRLPYYNTFFKTSNQPAAELAERLAGLAPAGLNHAFFANSGSEANDTLIRMVRYFWQLENKPEKRVIISRDLGYHGSTTLTASMGGMTDMHRQAASLPDFSHIKPPYGFLYQNNMDEATFAAEAASWLEMRITELGADKIAAFIAEPVQGAGGVIIPPKGYFDHIQKICRKHDILLLADEVITGFGRTGHWFGCQAMDFQPDAMSLAKGLTSGYMPMSAVMLGERLASRLISDGGEFYHGFTYSGHPVAAAVALANLEIIETEGLVERVRTDTGPYLASALSSLAEHPLVGETRSFGMLGAIELLSNKPEPQLSQDFAPPGKADLTQTHPAGRNGQVGMICRDHAINLGLMMRAVRDAMIISPPLTITHAEIDKMVSIARAAIDATWQTLEDC